jgi:hypothetical protein
MSNGNNKVFEMTTFYPKFRIWDTIEIFDFTKYDEHHHRAYQVMRECANNVKVTSDLCNVIAKTNNTLSKQTKVNQMLRHYTLTSTTIVFKNMLTSLDHS